jgi:hypothetical protein
MGLERYIGSEVLLLAGFVVVVWLIHRYSPKDPRGPVLVLLLGVLLAIAGCTLFPGGPAGLPPIKPPVTDPSPPAPTPAPEPQRPKPPQGAWRILPPATPPQRVIDVVNAAAQRAAKCPEGYPSRCVVGPGFPTVSREQEHADSIAFGRATCAELPAGWVCGFHDEGDPGDELAIAESAAGPFHGIKIATLGGQIVVAWVAMPREACFGGGDPSGEDENIHPRKIGCPGVGGGAYRGDWAPGEWTEVGR